MRSPGESAAARWTIFILALVHAAILFFHRLDTGGDNLDYLVAARSILQGDWSGLVGWHRPPGYPLMIVALLKLTGQGIPPGVLHVAPAAIYTVKMANAVFFAMAALVSLIWLQRGSSSRAVAFAAAALLATNQLWASTASVIWAETLLLLSSTLALLLWDRLATGVGSARIALPALVLVTLVSMLFKYQGVALGVAVIATAMLRRDVPKWWVLVLAVSCCLLAIAGLIAMGNTYLVHHMSTDDPYSMGVALKPIDRFHLWFATYAWSWSDLLAPRILGARGLLELVHAGWAGVGVIAICCALCAIGIAATIRRSGISLAHVYLASAMGMLLVWPDYLQRYLLPLAPVGYWFFVEGIAWTSGRVASFARNPAGKALAFRFFIGALVVWGLAINTFAGVKNMRRVAEFRGTPPWNPARYHVSREDDFADYIGAGQWIGSNTPPESVVFCRKALFIELASGRPCKYYVAYASPDELWGAIQDAAGTGDVYILKDSFPADSTYGRMREKFLTPALAIHPDRVVGVYTTEMGSVIYRVR